MGTGIGSRGAIRFDGVDDSYELAYNATLSADTQDVFVVAATRGITSVDESVFINQKGSGSYAGYGFIIDDNVNWHMFKENKQNTGMITNKFKFLTKLKRNAT